MARESTVTRAFSGGELAPTFHSRADTVRYATGLRRCRNFIVMRSGGVANRPGTRFVAECKTTSSSVILMRYVSERDGFSMLIEHGVGYFRFYLNGAAVSVTGVTAWNSGTYYLAGDLVSRSGVNYYCIVDNDNVDPATDVYDDTWYPLVGTRYEVPSPFATGLFNWDQSEKVITLTSSDHAPYELVYEGTTRWIIRPVVTTPAVPAPEHVVATPGDISGLRTYSYVVTARDLTTGEESEASLPATISSIGEPTEDAPHTLAWTPVLNTEYAVYCDPYTNGIYGFLSLCTTNAFSDPGFEPDFARTPPQARVLFATTDNYPSISASHQQRRLFASTIAEPDGIWGSRPGLPSNFSVRSPLQEDDAITFRIAGNNAHPVRALIALKTLIAGTGGGAWTIGEPKVPLTPMSISANQDTYAGFSQKRVCVVGTTVIYLQARGSVIRDLQFDQEIEGFNGRDVTLMASHLFDGKSIGSIDFAETPSSIVWVTRGDNTLLGMTYIPEEDVFAWHRHDTGGGGSFNQVCVVPEQGEDAVYLLVSRNIDGATVFYIERLASRVIGEDTFNVDAYFVDAGLSYSGAPATTFTGLDHLEGEIVAVLADGAVVFDGDPLAADAGLYTVTGGSITIPTAASDVHIGLPIAYGEIDLLDLDVQGSAIRDKEKRTGGLTLLVDRSTRGFWAGPDSAHLKQVRLAPWDNDPGEYTGQVEVNLTATFNRYGRVFVRQTDPLPLAILGVMPSVDLGG